MSFSSENEMTNYFREYISSVTSDDDMLCYEQFRGLFGIPDFLIIKQGKKSIELIVSVELKLNNWNRALKQAFKYKSFSHISFVIFDETNFDQISKKISQFKKSNIGLASFNKNKEIKVLYFPKLSEPYCHNLLTKLLVSLQAKLDQNIQINIYSNSRINELTENRLKKIIFRKLRLNTDFHEKLTAAL